MNLSAVTAAHTPAVPPTTYIAKDVLGTVLWFNSDKGFGFITPTSGVVKEHVFVHFTAINVPGYRDLTDNQRVIFDVVQGAKGVQAENVRPVSEPAPTPPSGSTLSKCAAQLDAAAGALAAATTWVTLQHAATRAARAGAGLLVPPAMDVPALVKSGQRILDNASELARQAIYQRAQDKPFTALPETVDLVKSLYTTAGAARAAAAKLTT